MTTSTARRQCILAAAALPFVGSLWAQTWPQRAVTLVVPAPAGNPTDGMTRRLQPLLAKALGQSVIVENISGASGTIAAAKVAASPRDGHMVLVATASTLIVSPMTIKEARFSPSDFRMVAMFGKVGYVLVSRPDLPQATLADLLALKGQRGAKPLSYGSSGPGSLIHLMSEQFGKSAGIPLVHVPYRGVPPMTQDLVAGQLDLGFLPVSRGTAELIEQGKLRAYGLSSTAPSVWHPNLKSLATQHPSLKDYDYDVWSGFHIPASTPAAVAQHWHKVFYDAFADPGFREWAKSEGREVVSPMSQSELDDFYKREIVRYQAIANSIGVEK